MMIIINLDIYVPISLCVVGTMYLTVILSKNTKNSPRYGNNESTQNRL